VTAGAVYAEPVVCNKESGGEEDAKGKSGVKNTRRRKKLLAKAKRILRRQGTSVQAAKETVDKALQFST